MAKATRVLVAALLGAVSFAVQAPDAKAATGLVRVAATDFIPAEFSVGYRVGHEGRANATVRGIPAGATITKVTMYVRDQSEEFDARLTVAKHRIEKGKGWGVAVLSSSGTNKKVQPFSTEIIDFPIVEEDQIVSMTLDLPDGNLDTLLFSGATLEYSVP